MGKLVMNDNVRQWCKRQCELQHATTPADFAGMERAWTFAHDCSMHDHKISVVVIKAMGLMIDPVANPGGQFRTGPAVFMDGGSATHADEIDMALRMLLLISKDMTPAEIYRELMYIHPFKDGNGRMGALVYNWLNGTLDSPGDPPEYK